VFINPNYRFQSYEIGASPLPDLTGKIVILGVTADGVSNPLAIPSGAQHPHQPQASILETLINGDSVSIPNWTQPVDLAALLVLALSLIIISRLKYSIVWIGLILGGTPLFTGVFIALSQNKHVHFIKSLVRWTYDDEER
jgi:CHASE2 domain-containing sensor protein